MISCELIDSVGTDRHIVAAAKVIHPADVDMTDGTPAGIINFMMREKHGSPFEHAFMSFTVNAPIFVSREHFRHRIGHSYNEISTRYMDIRKAGAPYIVEGQRQIGKTGAYTFEPLPESALSMGRAIIAQVHADTNAAYDQLLALGYGKQDAGTVFTISHATRYTWSCNPRSLMHFLNLRNAPQARREIRWVAEIAEEVFSALFPITHAAFVEHGRIAP